MLSCQDHDYIEIACMYHIPVRLALLSGAIIEGKALDCRYDSARREIMLLKTLTGEQQVETADIKSMQALVINPHFDTIDFIQTA